MRTGKLQLGPGGVVCEVTLPNGVTEIIMLDNIMKCEVETTDPGFSSFLGNTGFGRPPEFRMNLEAIPTARYSYDYDPGYVDAEATEISDVREIGSGLPELPEKAGG